MVQVGIRDPGYPDNNEASILRVEELLEQDPEFTASAEFIKSLTDGMTAEVEQRGVDAASQWLVDAVTEMQHGPDDTVVDIEPATVDLLFAYAHKARAYLSSAVKAQEIIDRSDKRATVPDDRYYWRVNRRDEALLRARRVFVPEGHDPYFAPETLEAVVERLLTGDDSAASN